MDSLASEQKGMGVRMDKIFLLKIILEEMGKKKIASCKRKLVTKFVERK